MLHVKQRIISTGLMAALSCSAASAAVISYEGDALPTDPSTSPQWTQLYNDAGSSQSVSGGVLTVSTPTGTDLAYRLWGAPGGWDPTASGSTIDIGLKVIDQSPGSGRSGDLFVSTASRAWLVRWNPVVFSEELDGGSYLMDTTDAFHNYQFKIAGANGPLEVYVDGAGAPAVSFAGIPYGSGPRIDFGDTLGGDGGTIQWDYIRWTNGDVPEPATLSLAAMGAVSLLRRRQK